MLKNLTKSILASAALLGFALSGAAHADVDYPFAATGFISGGGKWLDVNADAGFLVFDDEREIALIVGGGDFVIPVNGYWNIQLGGAFYTEHEHFEFFGPNSNTQFQGGGIAFWRSPEMGVFGFEAGILSPFEGGTQYVKLGGVAEYYFGDMATVGAFGGALVPFGDDDEFVDTGFYAGGHATWYASHSLAFGAFARYTETGISGAGSSITNEHLVVGGKVRYLTSMPGVELYASAAYTSCQNDFDINVGDIPFNGSLDDEGVEAMVGIKIRLGGHSDSLMNIDRSNAIDTDTWVCGPAAFVPAGPVGDDDDDILINVTDN